MSIDLLSNMLSAIKNASLAGNAQVELPHSKACEDVAKTLKEAGYIAEVKSFKPKDKAYKMLNIQISYADNGLASINDLKRVSKPGRRVYATARDLRPVMNGFGISVVSTSRGVMSGEDARKKKLGGEVLCKVW